MIPARKSRWFSAWFSRHCEGRLRRSFEQVRVHGLERLAEAGAKGSVLLVSNHTAWWDPLVAIWLTQRLLQLDSFAMMDAKNLRRLPFFAKVGAFGVDLDDPLDRSRVLRHAAKLLRRERTLVWIFAQGDERPVTEPLAFRPGTTILARLAPRAQVVPLALRYEMGKTERPVALISIGEPIAAGCAHEDAVAAELARIETWVRAPNEDFRPVLQAPRSWLGALAEWWLGRFTRSALQSPRGTEDEVPTTPA